MRILFLCLDEADPASLPPKRGYITDTLRKTAKNYSGLEAGFFLNRMIQATSTETTPLEWLIAVKNLLDLYDDEDLDEIDNQLRGIPVDVVFRAS